MIDHDRIFKELIKTFFVEFLELFFPEVHADLDVRSIEFLDKQVFTDVTEGEKHEADLVVKARFRGQESFFLFHIEAESQGKEQKRRNFKRRMFVYFARLHEDSGLPVYPIAVLSYDSPRTPAEHEYRVDFPGFEVLKFSFRVIQLNRLKWRDFLKHENPVASALMAKMRMTKQERKQVKFECLRLMLTLKLDPARMQMIAGFVDTYLPLNPEEERWIDEKIKEAVPEQKEKFMEVMTRYEKAALQKGLLQGLEEGERNLLILLLTHRFGELTADQLERIGHLSTKQIEALSKAFLTFKESAEITSWINKLQTQ
ncbi:MAG: Rpn family recombination-promoting nuclease/putative transposase [Blastocatellia bacterium]